MQAVNVDGLTDEQIRAIQTLITYFRHSRLIDGFYGDKPLDPIIIFNFNKEI